MVDYGLATNFGKNQGLSATIPEYGSVVKDFNMNERSEGFFDIGALEKAE